MTALDGVHGTVCDATQYQQSQDSYGSNSPWISCLTHGDIIGLVLSIEASLFSCLCIVFIFILISRNVYRYKKEFTGTNHRWTLFKEPADIYMFFLFLFDFLQTIGGLLNIRWAQKGIVTTGSFCTSQGVIEQIGDLGVALITLMLAVHTFAIAVLPVGPLARSISFTLVLLACVFIILWVAISPNVHKHYETPTPYWCWISPQFLGDRLGGEYVWLWIALFASVLLYVPLYFWAEGKWLIESDYKFHWRKRKDGEGIDYKQRRAALSMLLYPLAYSLIVLPISITRWLQFSHHHVPSGATFFANSMFYLSGAINVLLFLTLKPKLLLFPDPKTLDHVEDTNMELTPDAPQATIPVIIADPGGFRHSPEPTSIPLGDGRSRDDPTRPRRISDDI